MDHMKRPSSARPSMKVAGPRMGKMVSPLKKAQCGGMGRVSTMKRPMRTAKFMRETASQRKF